MRVMVNLGRGRKVSEMKTVFAFKISNWGHFGDSKFSRGTLFVWKDVGSNFFKGCIQSGKNHKVK